MPQQLDLCDPYLAAEAKYEVIELVGQPSIRAATLTESELNGWSRVGTTTSDYLYAVEQARTRCLLHGKEVWVVDRNDQDWVAFRVSPDEYTAKALATRRPMLTRFAI